MYTLGLLAAVGLALGTGMSGCSPDRGDGPESGAGAVSGAVESSGPEQGAGRDVLRYQVRSIDGEQVDLEQFRGKVVLIVNTASRCGLTPQYAGLQSLYEEHKDEGLVILGFPANNFAGQEPGSNREIAEFCEARYGVSFPMFEKLSVKGEDQHPLYKQLSALSAEPDWNFTKYLVDRDGYFVERFGSRTVPGDRELNERVDELLGSSGGA